MQKAIHLSLITMAAMAACIVSSISAISTTPNNVARNKHSTGHNGTHSRTYGSGSNSDPVLNFSSGDGECRWDTRPCGVDLSIDCTLRNLTMRFAAKLLEPTFGAIAVASVADALKMSTYCASIKHPLQYYSGGAKCPAKPHHANTECNYSGAPSGDVLVVAAEGGSDGGPGTFDNPLASVEEAVTKSRSRTHGSGATIVLLPGTHYLRSTIELGPTDSGLVITGCTNQSPVLSAGILISGQWKLVPGSSHVWMIHNATGMKSKSSESSAIDGLFLSDPSTGDFGSFNVRLIRARHPNSNPEFQQWPSGPQNGTQYDADMYIGPEKINYPSNWMEPPTWQQVPPKEIEIDSPNWNTDGGLPPNVSFTSNGGMSPFYQARVGGPMNRFVGGINPGPTRTNCLLTAVGHTYPAGCAVPGGVHYNDDAFWGVPSPRTWARPQTGIVHALHPLGCPVEETAIPWFNWQWRLSSIYRHNVTQPPTPPPYPSSCGVKQTIHRGCCGGENVGPATILKEFNVTQCAALCCNNPKCGVAVLTKGQNGDSVVRCWLTHLSEPNGMEPSPSRGEAITILTRNTSNSGSALDGLMFGDGGWQSLQGSPVGSHFYIENVRELLDSEGEWFHDAESDTLYVWRNTSQEQEHSNAVYVGSVFESAIKVVGTADQPAANIRLDGITFRHTTTDLLAPYEAPGGGDQSVHRGAAVFIEGAQNVSVVGCRFDRIDGSAVFVSRWARDIRIVSSEIAFSGSAGVIVMGEAHLINGTGGRFPRRTVIEGNWIHDGGVWSKNYLGGSIFMALQAETIVRGNVLYNTPRSSLTFNDGFGGGDTVEGNLMFNSNRESSDTGVIYTYNRLPFLTTIRNGTASLIPAFRTISGNLFFGNYGSVWGIDNDDGSSFYNNINNVNVYSPAKHSTFSTGGHTKNNTGSIYVVYGCCDTGGGFYESYDTNECFILKGSNPTSAACDPVHPVSTPEHPVPTPARFRNTYYVAEPSDFRIQCGESWNLTESQAHGMEVGSSVLPLGSGMALAETITSKSEPLLGLSPLS